MNLDKFHYIIDSTNPEALKSFDKGQIDKVHKFLKNFSSDKVIYGINTGFGPMAQFKIENGKLNELQYNLIRSHSNGHGDPLSFKQVKALMIARYNSFSQGFSGVSTELMEVLESFIRKGIHPFIPKHGGVGASGDLVQLAHLGLCMIGEGYCLIDGKQEPTKEVLTKAKIQPLKLHLRDGLALINGTSCMTGIAAINVINAQKLIELSIKISSVLNEITDSYGDSFSSELNNAKRHDGQQKVAKMMRGFLQDSQLLKSRNEELYSDSEEQKRSQFKNKVQEYYSLRCVPQIVGPILETVENAERVVEAELNSASDNPIVDMDSEYVFHGGNFHGDYISMEMDKLKIGITKLSMLMERQFNYLMNAKINEKFKPFLNEGTLGLNFGLQGMQFAATSTTAENQTLSNPMSIHSISCNNDNQDIVSMGTNSALMTEKVISNTFEVLSVLLIGTAKACETVDKSKLSRCAIELMKEVEFINFDDHKDRAYFEELKQLKENLTEL
jgi:histidine ammonia-lyase